MLVSFLPPARRGLSQGNAFRNFLARQNEFVSVRNYRRDLGVCLLLYLRRVLPGPPRDPRRRLRLGMQICSVHVSNCSPFSPADDVLTMLSVPFPRCPPPPTTPFDSQIASWRGGAVESGGGGPTMNLKLGLVRVAGYGIIAGSLCLKVRENLPSCTLLCGMLSPYLFS